MHIYHQTTFQYFTEVFTTKKEKNIHPKAGLSIATSETLYMCLCNLDLVRFTDMLENANICLSIEVIFWKKKSLPNV